MLSHQNQNILSFYTYGALPAIPSLPDALPFVALSNKEHEYCLPYSLSDGAIAHHYPNRLFAVCIRSGGKFRRQPIGLQGLSSTQQPFCILNEWIQMTLLGHIPLHILPYICNGCVIELLLTSWQDDTDGLSIYKCSGRRFPPLFKLLVCLVEEGEGTSSWHSKDRNA